jgi:hypothetical protein
MAGRDKPCPYQRPNVAWSDLVNRPTEGVTKMIWKRFSALSFLTLAAALAAACSFSFSTASIAEVQLAKGVTDKMEAVNPTNTFESTDAVINCLVKLANAPDKTVIKAVWTAVNTQGQSPNTKFGETPLEIDGGKNVVNFNYTPPPSGLPVGEYKVDLYLNPQPGKEEPPTKTVTFSVKAGRVIINEVKLSASENGAPATEFPGGTAEIFCKVNLRGIAPGTQVSAAWVAVEVSGAEPNQEIKRPSVTLEAGQNLATFNLSFANGFPPGRYRVDIYLGDATSAEKNVAFTVAE